MKGLEVIAQNRLPPPATKPTYKAYQKFLGTYNENNQTEQTNLSSSSASSASTMLSESESVPVAFDEYLQNYGTKKFNPVKPNLSKKNVKTEIFIQVNEDDDKNVLHGRKFNTLKSRKPPGKVILTRQNSLNKHVTSSGPLSPAAHQVILSPQVAKNDQVPDEMIYAKTAVLNELFNRPPKLHKSPSPTFKPSVEIANSTNTSSQIPPLPPKLPDFLITTPANCYDMKNVTFLTKPAENVAVQSRLNKPVNTEKATSKIVLQLAKPTDSTDHHQTSTPDLIDSCRTSRVEHSINKFERTPSETVITNGKRSPPLTRATLPPAPPKFLGQQKQTLDIEPITTTYVPVTDNTSNVDKKDPNVKRLVYNTYRGLLGAYNNRANNMVSLPKNTVVQDQGVSKQLESMELQGCLDRLNGRVNPSGENE